MDGANSEMLEQIGEENMFVFGPRANEIDGVAVKGMPRGITTTEPLLKSDGSQ